LSLLTQIFKPFQAETARIYLAFAVAWGDAAAGDRRRPTFYANADSASRTSIFTTLAPSLTYFVVGRRHRLSTAKVNNMPMKMLLAVT
jgi:hypothetical protein